MKKQFSLLLFSIIFFTSPCFSDVYKWVDDDGNVHYTNKPRKNATKVDLPPSTTYTAANAKNKKDSTTENTETTKKTVKVNKQAEKEKTATVDDKPEYDVIEIIEPEENKTIRNDQGEVVVKISLSPTLGEGHIRQLILDNAALPKIILPANSATLSGLERGKHQFVLEIKDAKGKVIGKSTPRKFVLRKAAIKQ